MTLGDTTAVFRLDCFARGLHHFDEQFEVDELIDEAQAAQQTQTTSAALYRNA